MKIASSSLRRLAPLLLLALALPLAACSKSKSGPTSPGTPKELDSGNIANGGTFVHTFANAGTFDYHCAIHGITMSGSVHVVAGSAASAGVSIENNFYTPPTAQIAPGGTVTWTNAGSTHTVTSD
jgi:plastocyanin